MLTKLLPLIILCGFPLLLLSIPLRITARKSLLLSSLNKNNFKQNEKINNNLMTIKRITPSLKIRGGGFVEEEEDYDDDYDDDDDLITTNIDSSSSSSIILNKIRNLIRSLIDIGSKKIPSLTNIFKDLLKQIEELTGVSLLPPKQEESNKEKKTKTKKTKKTASSSKKNIISTKQRKNDNDDEKEEGNTKKPKRNQKTSAKTKKHLSSSITSKNPNYRIQRELKEFVKSPPDNLIVKVGSNIRIWIVTILGAKNSIYEGEVFKLRIQFPKDYPAVPPSVYFLQPNLPQHEHVYTNGDICLSLLGNGWRPTMTAQSIAVSILSILSSAQYKQLPMDNARHAQNKPGQYQKDWVYHDDNC